MAVTSHATRDARIQISSQNIRIRR